MSDPRIDDSYFMWQAMELAERCYSVRGLQPPYAGSIVVINGNIEGRGHKRCFYNRGRRSLVHSERDAINRANSNRLPYAELYTTRNLLQDAELYTTLEPCPVDYDNKTIRACSELIVESGIKRVVVGLHPRNGLDSEGIRYMIENGIEVTLFDDLQRELFRLTNGIARKSR